MRIHWTGHLLFLWATIVLLHGGVRGETVTATVQPLLYFNNQATILVDDPTPIRFYLSIYRPSTKNGDLKYWERAFESFRVTIDVTDLQTKKTTRLPEDNVKLQYLVSPQGKPKWSCIDCLVEVHVAEGWPEGPITITGRFDRTVARQNQTDWLQMEGNVANLLQVRLFGRKKKDEFDELMRLRHLVMRYYQGYENRLYPNEYAPALANLFKAFPDDCYGCYIAAERVISDKRYAEAIPYYERILERIRVACNWKPSGKLFDDTPMENTDAFKKLYFDYLTGLRSCDVYRTPDAIYRHIHELRNGAQYFADKQAGEKEAANQQPDQ
ncbi:MAG: hypothetical protein BWY76_00853 [bacterium ADurb.Bin429]|nr:MAG: hypothetical protein BWY76_00853 [bacterium ADurb.Bin429]